MRIVGPTQWGIDGLLAGGIAWGITSMTKSERAPGPAEVPAEAWLSRSKGLLFGLLLLAWVLPGLIGRDPWKADEAYSFGLVLNMAQTGDLVVPTLGSDPFMEKPPAFYLTATAFTRLLSSFLAPHEAARGACVFYMALTFLCLALSSRELNGPGSGGLAVLLLLGSVGLVHTAHMLQTDVSLVTGYTLAIYGLLLGMRRPWLGGLLCGTGTGLGFLSKGLLAPGALGVAVLCLLAFRPWRNRDYGRLLGGILLAVVPWVTIWPWALYHRSPELFHDWFWNNNVARLIGGSPYAPTETRPAWFYLGLLCGFGWPVFPLALWGLWRERRSAFKERGVQVTVLASLTLLLVLSSAHQKRSLYATPLLAPLALLAVRGVRGLPERFARIATRLVVVVCAVGAAVAWFGWSAWFTHWPAMVLRRVASQVPAFTPAFSAATVGVALLATALWAGVFLRPRWTPGTALAASWAAAVALLYLLGMTLWLPVTNGSSSYRRDFAGLREAVGREPGLISSRGLGEPQRAMLHYYTGLKPLQEETHGRMDCRWELIQGLDQDGKRPEAPGAGWRLAWSGRHHRELFCLYRRDS